MVRRVDPLMREWFGIVSGVLAPSGFSRASEMCSRTRRNPRDSNASITRFFGASAGNFGTMR